MDAERLVTVSRNALAKCRVVRDVVAEAWQAQALAQAIGAWLAVYGPPEVRGEARALCETGARGVGALDQPDMRSGAIRAAQLKGVADVRATLKALVVLLEDVGIALVGVACTTGQEALYWQCIEAVDAADESTDRAAAMLRILAERDIGRPPDASRGRAGPRAGAAPTPLGIDGGCPSRAAVPGGGPQQAKRSDPWEGSHAPLDSASATAGTSGRSHGPHGADLAGPQEGHRPGARGGFPGARGSPGPVGGPCERLGTVDSAAGSW